MQPLFRLDTAENWSSANGKQYFKKPNGPEYRFEYKYDDEVFVENVA